MQIASDKISYTGGLTKKLSKTVYFPPEIYKMSKSIKSSNGVVGHLPCQFIKEIPFDIRHDKINEFHRNMGFFVRYVLPLTKDSKVSSFLLTKLMRHSKVISKESGAIGAAQIAMDVYKGRKEILGIEVNI